MGSELSTRRFVRMDNFERGTYGRAWFPRTPFPVIHNINSANKACIYTYPLSPPSFPPTITHCHYTLLIPPVARRENAIGETHSIARCNRYTDHRRNYPGWGSYKAGIRHLLSAAIGGAISTALMAYLDFMMTPPRAAFTWLLFTAGFRNSGRRVGLRNQELGPALGL